MHKAGGTTYVGIPKAGSSTLMRHVFHGAEPGAESMPLAERHAFTFVREPLERLLSGYGTLETRLAAMSQDLLPLWTQERRSDVRRFEEFVNYLVSGPADRGFVDFNHTEADVQARRAHKQVITHCLWKHVVPQMWIIRAWTASPLAYIGRVENFKGDLMEIHRRWHSVWNFNMSFGSPSQVHNKDEGAHSGVDRRRLQRCAPRAIAKLVETYLAADYECLGYPKPLLPPADAPLPDDCKRSRGGEKKSSHGGGLYGNQQQQQTAVQQQKRRQHEGASDALSDPNFAHCFALKTAEEKRKCGAQVGARLKAERREAEASGGGDGGGGGGGGGGSSNETWVGGGIDKGGPSSAAEPPPTTTTATDPPPPSPLDDPFAPCFKMKTAELRRACGKRVGAASGEPSWPRGPR